MQFFEGGVAQGPIDSILVAIRMNRGFSYPDCDLDPGFFYYYDSYK